MAWKLQDRGTLQDIKHICENIACFIKAWQISIVIPVKGQNEGEMEMGFVGRLQSQDINISEQLEKRIIQYGVLLCVLINVSGKKFRSILDKGFTSVQLSIRIL